MIARIRGKNEQLGGSVTEVGGEGAEVGGEGAVWLKGWKDSGV